MDSNTADPISERIVSVAARRFIEDGFGATSMLAIANEAKTSKREIYDRFGSKEALFVRVMSYLCDLGNDASAPEKSATLEGIMKDTARAVLTRFLLPETRGVLIAALGAGPTFPDIPKLFWDSGPGQAVDALATLFAESPELNVRDHQTAQAEAHRFIMSCVAPFTLSYLFDADYVVADSEIEFAIDTAISKTKNDLLD